MGGEEVWDCYGFVLEVRLVGSYDGFVGNGFLNVSQLWIGNQIIGGQWVIGVCDFV